MEGIQEENLGTRHNELNGDDTPTGESGRSKDDLVDGIQLGESGTVNFELSSDDELLISRHKDVVHQTFSTDEDQDATRSLRVRDKGVLKGTKVFSQATSVGSVSRTASRKGKEKMIHVPSTIDFEVPNSILSRPIRNVASTCSTLRASSTRSIQL